MHQINLYISFTKFYITQQVILGTLSRRKAHNQLQSLPSEGAPPSFSRVGLSIDFDFEVDVEVVFEAAVKELT